MTAPRGPCGIVALLTDFGLTDPYVGVMKGVILGRFPAARIVDLAHGIPPQDVVAANFALRGAFGFLPEESVVVVVVDPGVGSERRIVAARAHDRTFLAPDNGVLTGVLGAGDPVHTVTDRSLFLSRVSRTFHGRDVFAPVAARLAAGLPVDRVGPCVADAVRLDLPVPRRDADGALRGEVLYADGFGNLVTNFSEAEVAALGERTRATLVAPGSAVEAPVVDAYACVAADAPLAIVGSFGFLEIAVNGGDAARRFAAGRGTPVLLAPLTGS